MLTRQDEEAPHHRPLVAPPHAHVFGENLLADLWFVPGTMGGEFILHCQDDIEAFHPKIFDRCGGEHGGFL